MPRPADHISLPDIDEPVTLDRICGDWHIHQLARGHRFSTDDMVCAWLALQHQPSPARHLDLGTGVGSVGTLVLWHRLGRPDREQGRARTDPEHALPLMVGVEAQEVSHRLNHHTLRHNALTQAVELRHCDLRSPSALPEHEHGTYGLVTGSPPYFPLGKGVVSPHHQRAACRMELRGDVFDYCAVAAKALTPDGVFCLVHAWGDPRPEAALEQAGLTIRDRRDIYFRRNRTPTIAMWAAGLRGPRRDGEPLIVREPTGEMTEQYLRIRKTMGAPEYPSRRPSPA